MNEKKVNIAGKVFTVNYNGTVLDESGAPVDFPVCSGFKRKSIRDGNKVITIYLHKLMGYVWLGSEDVMHIDGNKLNNEARNLRVAERKGKKTTGTKSSKRSRKSSRREHIPQE